MLCSVNYKYNVGLSQAKRGLGNPAAMGLPRGSIQARSTV